METRNKFSVKRVERGMIDFIHPLFSLTPAEAQNLALWLLVTLDLSTAEVADLYDDFQQAREA